MNNLSLITQRETNKTFWSIVAEVVLENIGLLKTLMEDYFTVRATNINTGTRSEVLWGSDSTCCKNAVILGRKT